VKGNAVAITIVVVVVIAIGGIVFAVQAAKPKPLTSEQQIGAGLGQLVGGIIGVATGDE
jgi:hypothetical protein